MASGSSAAAAMRMRKISAKSAASHARRAFSVTDGELTLAVALARGDLIELGNQRGEAALTGIEEAPLVMDGLGSMRASSRPGRND